MRSTSGRCGLVLRSRGAGDLVAKSGASAASSAGPPDHLCLAGLRRSRAPWPGPRGRHLLVSERLDVVGMRRPRLVPLPGRLAGPQLEAPLLGRHQGRPRPQIVDLLGQQMPPPGRPGAAGLPPTPRPAQRCGGCPCRSHVSPRPPVAGRTGAWGDTTLLDPRSRRNRISRKRRPATNAISQLIVYIGLPALRAPGAFCPGWSHHTRRSADPAGLRHRLSHTGYQCHRSVERQAAPGDPRQGPLPNRLGSRKAPVPGPELGRA
jgi:hypothetical protein